MAEDSGLLEFQKQFLDEGYDDISVVAAMTADDLKEIGISKMGHRKKILLKIEELKMTRREETIQQKLSAATSKRPLIQSVLPCSSKRAMPDQLPYQKSKFWYENPQHPRTKFFNEMLPGIFEGARYHMSETSFETYLFKERSKRWDMKSKIDKLERKLKYMLSDDNNACFGKYLNASLSHVSPSDRENCERGVKELSGLEEELLKEKLSTNESYGELFSDNGQLYIWANEQKEYLENLISNLISLLDTVQNAKSKISVYVSPTYKALTHITSRRKTSHVTRRKKENVRKARNRKLKRGESAMQSLIHKLVDDFTYSFCFPEGYKKIEQSQHSVCEEEINQGALENLRSPDVERLDCLVSQGFFALDALQVIGQIMSKC